MAPKPSEWCFLPLSNLTVWLNCSSTFGCIFSSSQKSKLAIKLSIQKILFKLFHLPVELITFCKLTVLQMQFLVILRYQFYLLNPLFAYLWGEKRIFLSSRPQCTFHECLGKLTASMTWLRKRVQSTVEGMRCHCLAALSINRYPWAARPFLPGALLGRHTRMACWGCAPGFSDSREDVTCFPQGLALADLPVAMPNSQGCSWFSRVTVETVCCTRCLRLSKTFMPHKCWASP